MPCITIFNFYSMHTPVSLKTLLDLGDPIIIPGNYCRPLNFNSQGVFSKCYRQIGYMHDSVCVYHLRTHIRLYSVWADACL